MSPSIPLGCTSPPAEAHPGAALALPGCASREADLAKTRISSAYFTKQVACNTLTHEQHRLGLWRWTQIDIRAPMYDPNGGVADTLR